MMMMREETSRACETVKEWEGLFEESGKGDMR